MLGIGRLGCDPRAAPQLPVGLQPRWVQPAWQAELAASSWVCSPQSASINIYALWQKRKKKKICSFVTLQQCRERILCCVVSCRVVLCRVPLKGSDGSRAGGCSGNKHTNQFWELPVDQIEMFLKAATLS